MLKGGFFFYKKFRYDSVSCGAGTKLNNTVSAGWPYGANLTWALASLVSGLTWGCSTSIKRRSSVVHVWNIYGGTLWQTRRIPGEEGLFSVPASTRPAIPFLHRGTPNSIFSNQRKLFQNNQSNLIQQVIIKCAVADAPPTIAPPRFAQSH